MIDLHQIRGYMTIIELKTYNLTTPNKNSTHVYKDFFIWSFKMKITLEVQIPRLVCVQEIL